MSKKGILTDEIVKGVISEFTERSIDGVIKYDTTLKDNNKDDFLQHLKEELMDAVCYIAKLQDQVKLLNNHFTTPGN